MTYRDSNLADSLLQDMSNIMDSDEHKSLFKSAQAKRQSPSDVVSVDAQLKALYDAITNETSISGATGRQRTPEDINVQKMISAFRSRTLKASDADTFRKTLTDYVAKHPNFAALLPAKTLDMAVADIQSRTQPAGPPPQTGNVTAEDVINSIVKIADFLGENEYELSERIADNLIESIVVEAKKKAKKKEEKKMKKEKETEKKDKKEKKECEEEKE